MTSSERRPTPGSRAAAWSVGAFLLVAGCTGSGDDGSSPPEVGTTTTTAVAVPVADAGPDNLHVPSPEWEEQIIYFLMTDRFADGDPSNNDQGSDEYDPEDARKYQGGDLAGIQQQLDYIEGLGATTIWITPPVANQWWDPIVEFGGYHGYWAANFMEVDPHLGTLDEYRALSDALHDRGMYLIQDIVLNHVGNFFSYDGPFDPLDPAENFVLNTGSVPVTAPTQSPFDLNDVTKPENKEAGIYHFTPPIADFNNAAERTLYQLADLDDLATKNPVVREALRRSYGYWIEEVGVDGFRIDTIVHVEDDLWNDFHWNEDESAPGVDLVARATGRDSFYTFGEAFIGSAPLLDTGDRRVAGYVGTVDEPGMDAALNFPLQNTISRVFAGGQATNDIAFRVDTAMELYPNPYVVPNFIDNHDMARFLTAGSVAGLEQATMFLMTAPGIPVIYYGTEQGMTEGRPSMFAGGVGSGGVDHYDTGSDLYRHIAALADLRLSDRVFTRGEFRGLQSTEQGPGVLAYSRTLGEEQVIVVMNTSDAPVVMDRLDTGLAEGTVLTNLFGLVLQEDVVVGRDGLITMELAGREGLILRVSGDIEAVATTEATFEVTGFVGDPRTGYQVSGTFSEVGAVLRVIVDGDVARAATVPTPSDGTWTTTIDPASFPPGTTEHTIRFFAPDQAFISEAFPFTIENPPNALVVSVEDPAGDTSGPQGTYRLPTDPSFGTQMDIRAVTVEAPGQDLIVTLTMDEVTDVWNPVNGFDHVMFHVFIDLPALKGATVLPLLNAEAPGGMAWDYLGVVEGWSSRIASSSGASRSEYGVFTGPAPLVVTDKESGTVTLTFLGEALGKPADYTGTQVYVTTWDWNGVDAEYRPLSPDGGQWAFGGGDGTVDPIIADAAGPVVFE